MSIRHVSMLADTLCGRQIRPGTGPKPRNRGQATATPSPAGGRGIGHIVLTDDPQENRMNLEWKPWSVPYFPDFLSTGYAALRRRDTSQYRFGSALMRSYKASGARSRPPGQATAPFSTLAA